MNKIMDMAAIICTCGGTVARPTQGDAYCTNVECGKRVNLCATCERVIETGKYCSDECRDSNPQYRQKSNYARIKRHEEDYSIEDAMNAVFGEYFLEKFDFSQVAKDAHLYDEAMMAFIEFTNGEIAELIGKSIALIKEKINDPRKKQGALAALGIVLSFHKKANDVISQLEDIP